MEINKNDVISVAGGGQNIRCICRFAKQILSKSHCKYT